MVAVLVCQYICAFDVSPLWISLEALSNGCGMYRHVSLKFGATIQCATKREHDQVGRYDRSIHMRKLSGFT